MVWDQLSNYTTSLNEMVYFYSFLWPHYMKPIYDVDNMPDNEELLDHLIKNRGNMLHTHSFRQILQELLAHLYMHINSQDDIAYHIKKKGDDQFIEKTD